MVGEVNLPKTSATARFRGFVSGGDCQGEVNLPKTSRGARFRGLWVVVVAKEGWWVVVVAWER